MRKAGGIIALIAGVFSVLAALFTLVVGGAGKTFEAKGAETVLWLGWGGVAFSFLVIVLGAVCMGARSRWPGGLLMAAAVAGAILGGSFVALFMVLAFVGGLLAVIGKGQAPAAVATAICIAFMASTGSEATAQSKTIDIIDFLVDGRDLVGKTVTVTGCKFMMASDSVVICSAGSPGNIMLDSKTMAREDLRRALRQCAGLTVPESCQGSVTGAVTQNSFGIRLTKAAIGWQPST